MAESNPFGPGLLQFLRALNRRNERDWFQKNKQRYEDDVREPALRFIRAMRPKLAGISPYLVANDRKVGGSLMRIHRDVRFSKDKRPYKTNLGIQFRHVEGKDVHAPGLYFHVEPGTVFLGAGMWHPETQALAAVRQAIDRDPATWKRVRDDKRFAVHWELRGDSLQRPPRGFAPDHPMVDDLKRKDHIAICELDERDLARPDLVELVAGRYRQTRDYMAWQAAALGIPF